MAYRDIDWSGLEEQEDLETNSEKKFNFSFNPINWILNPIAFILKIFITIITDFTNIIKLTFNLFVVLGSLFIENLLPIMSKGFGLFFIIALLESISGDSSGYIFFGGLIIVVSYIAKIYLYNIPSIIWDEAIKSRITNKRYVIAISCIIIGSLLANIPAYLMLYKSLTTNMLLVIMGSYGLYLAISDKILERM